MFIKTVVVVALIASAIMTGKVLEIIERTRNQWIKNNSSGY